MIITVAGGTGIGETVVGAFDAAIGAAGIGNRNLICLSSVIPPGAKIATVPVHEARGQWGDRLYVVMAQAYATRHGEEAWAGLGWGFDGDLGLLVHAEGPSEAAVKQDIDGSLDDLGANRKLVLDDRGQVTTGVTYTGVPACAIVAAVFGSEPW